MISGVKYLTWAPVTGGGSGSAVTYGTGTAETDKMVHVDMSEDRNDDGFNADDHRIDHDNSINSASIALEVARLSSAMKKGILGHAEGTSDEMHVTDAPSPFVGVGFVVRDRYKGADTFRGYWYYKVQFSEGQRAWDTRGENINYQTESLEGDAEAVQLASGGEFTYYSYKELTGTGAETSAYSYVKTHAGISG